MKKSANKAKEAKNPMSPDILSQNLTDKSAEVGKSEPVKLPPYLEATLKAINELPEAKRALRTLTELGCDQTRVLAMLYRYCGGTRQQVAEWMRMARNFRDRLKRDSDRLLEDAELIDRILRNAYEPMTGNKFYSWSDAAGEVREIAQMMAAEAKAYDENLEGARPNREGMISSGRNSNLQELVWLIEEATDVKRAEGAQTAGVRPYSLIAPLVAAVKKDVERNYVKLADRLRNAVERSRGRQARAKEKTK